MRHHDANRKFGRKKDERNALIRSLLYALIKEGKVRTTEAKAKELRPHIEKLVTKARQGDLSAMRLITARLGSDTSAQKLIKDIAPRYKSRAGGYTRITKLPPRRSDQSPMAIIEFV